MSQIDFILHPDKYESRQVTLDDVMVEKRSRVISPPPSGQGMIVYPLGIISYQVIHFNVLGKFIETDAGRFPMINDGDAVRATFMARYKKPADGQEEKLEKLLSVLDVALYENKVLWH
jgi:hypothetical protein